MLIAFHMDVLTNSEYYFEKTFLIGYTIECKGASIGRRKREDVSCAGLQHDRPSTFLPIMGSTTDSIQVVVSATSIIIPNSTKIFAQ